jgi:hypothetical protein
MAHLPDDRPSRPRSALLLGVMLATAAALALLAAWQFLPLLAPQTVIRHSPWFVPIIRAEAYETVHPGSAAPPAPGPPGAPRMSLSDRLSTRDVRDAAVPRLYAALGDPDLRIRRVATATLLQLQYEEIARPDASALGTLRRNLDDPDRELSASSFQLLLLDGRPDAANAQALLDHLPQACGIPALAAGMTRHDQFAVFWDIAGEPHPLEVLRLVDVVARVQPWLESRDPRLVRLGLMTLRFSDDPWALELLAGQLGRHLESEEAGYVFDPAAYGLGRNPQPAATALIADALNDPWVERRRSAVRALTMRSGLPEALTLLTTLRTLVDDGDAEVRILAARCLASLPLARTLDDVAAILVRGGAPAEAALTTIGSVRRHLHRRADDASDEATRPENHALEARIVACFAGLAPRCEPAVRLLLVEYLGSTNEAETGQALRALRADADPAVSAAAAKRLVAFERRLAGP